jgi:hypothetical protein
MVTTGETLPLATAILHRATRTADIPWFWKSVKDATKMELRSFLKFLKNLKRVLAHVVLISTKMCTQKVMI